MKDILFSILRSKESSRQAFRHASDELATLLAAQATDLLKTKEVTVQTPVGRSQGYVLAHDVVLVPILRSGLALLPAFMHRFPNAGVGFVGMVRDEETAVARQYYQKLPTIPPGAEVIVLDPMIATGGSACSTLDLLVDVGVQEEQMLFVSVISAPEGVERMKTAFPGIRLLIAQEDDALNAKKFIVPGLGDFGDRYFGTE